MSSDEVVSILDDPARMQAVDRRNMLRQINELPEQCETALGIARSFEFNYADFEPSAVMLAGVGDSGFAADMVATAVAEKAGAPVISHHETKLPEWVSEKSLVAVVDYTGNSRAALEHYRDAWARGAHLVCVAGGGKLAETASADAVRVIKVPPGQPARTAVGYLFVALLGLFSQYRLTGPADDFVDSGIRMLKNVRESLRFEYPAARNLAKRTAQSLFGKAPLIVAASGCGSVIAARWQRQLGANSKQPAFISVLLGSAESELTAWQTARDGVPEVVFVFLREAVVGMSETALAVQRMLETVTDRYGVVELEIRGATPTEKMFHGLYLADYVSYYLALLNEVDPTPTVVPRVVEPAQSVEPNDPLDETE